jgi:hypothetical protein
VTWRQATLNPTSDILEDLPSRTFTGTVGPFASGLSVQYFMAIEDDVGNVVYFGVGTALVP